MSHYFDIERQKIKQGKIISFYLMMPEKTNTYIQKQFLRKY